MNDDCRLVYRGASPGADTNAYPLFDSTQSPSPFVHWQKDRMTVRIRCNAAGTLRVYSSNDRRTFSQVFADVAVSASTNPGTFSDFFVGDLQDVKVEFVNGGSAQTTFLVDMSLEDSSVKAT